MMVKRVAVENAESLIIRSSVVVRGIGHLLAKYYQCGAKMTTFLCGDCLWKGGNVSRKSRTLEVWGALT